MALHHAEVLWQRADQPFLDNRYSRGHLWRFDGGVEVPGSSSPSVVPLPMSVESAVDPEEAFVAALASCHMLWFLGLACEAGFCVDQYRDAAEGRMGKNAAGKLAITRVTLRPAVRFSGTPPSAEVLAGLHHAAHEQCFIANSVTSEVLCEPQLES
ncbi:peroxiredoxin [Pseudomonas alcaligenes]|uniref:Peroxiredoxin n=1 Tax=Aquipseudomonas alcaligenes TaxID=43263 RepID=A0ABR7RW57_AQUAC|nr:OsmC family protein [Pseudomonas alcaligenes]MBC9248989.1 peroxiredoxin [Pseudomonas alcaligenes]